MSSHREILTFQLGNYANYVSAHWWNIQESYFQYNEKTPSEICHDVLFREGRTFRGHPTFTPRTIFVDKRENSTFIPILDDESGGSKRNSTVLWDPNRVSSEYAEPPQKHEYINDLEKMEKGHRPSAKKDYNFEDTVRSWSDFLRTRYHPRSSCLVDGNLETEFFHSGNEIFNRSEESIVEKVRSYVEECDNAQGFQLLVDAVDAYGSVADHIVTHLRDEYGSKTVFSIPIIPSYYNNTGTLSDVHKMINILLTYQKLSEYSDVVVPLGVNRTAWRGLGPPIVFPHLTYDQSLFYHTSAILAAYLDTVTLKCRLREDRSTLGDIASGLNFWNRKICAASMSLPFPMSATAYLLDTLENYDDRLPLWQCLTPSCTIGNERIFYQRMTIRGVSSERLRNPSDTRRSSQAHTCKSVPELLHLYLSFYVNTISDVTSAKTPLKTETPFPQIFHRRISRVGSIDDSLARGASTDVVSCPVLAGLHSCKDIGRMLESLHSSVKGVNITRFHQFIGDGMDFDEYQECLEKVLLLGNEYVVDTEL